MATGLTIRFQQLGRANVLRSFEFCFAKRRLRYTNAFLECEGSHHTHPQKGRRPKGGMSFGLLLIRAEKDGCWMELPIPAAWEFRVTKLGSTHHRVLTKSPGELTPGLFIRAEGF